ncbi:MurR/RpiR family transcriptional regulator [Lapidilactobacillus achengensis]|uniref:MurR/RpiR family transcriptional regulator n=1 Tax=Lapidilactobacillus achengensis TaxID=2486000 RepID=A0ABW1UQN0_9LACO|nr:MurR/RpiR family transcriptional regulator [Lapidilactobacillus achengensis]
MTIIRTIEQNFNTLAEKERQVALFVMNNAYNVRNMSIKELADKTDTSIATVTRFCHKVNCTSYADLKMKLTIATTANEPAKPAMPDDNTLDAINNFYEQVIISSIQIFDETIIQEVIRKIKTAHRIFIMGIGSSGLTARELEFRLGRMGLTAFACTDSHTMKIYSSLVTAKDVVISISISGNTTEVVEATKLAKKQQAKIIAFTSFESSELTKTSDVTVLVYNALFLNHESFINSQFSLMYLIDVLSTYLLRDKRYAKNLERTVGVVHPNK